MANGTKKDRITILLGGLGLLLLVAASLSGAVLDFRVHFGNSDVSVALVLATVVGVGSLWFWFLTGTRRWGGEGLALRTHEGRGPVVKFSGSVYQGEKPGIRGSLNILAGDDGEAGPVRHFQSFDELKKILEEEYNKEAADAN
jgi:hypothetical protein